MSGNDLFYDLTDQDFVVRGLPYRVDEEITPTDGRLPEDLTDHLDELAWANRHVHMPTVWDAPQGRGVRVAVLDTGIDTAHPALKDAIEDAADFTGEGSVYDYDGHGTHCAGIIAGRETTVPFRGLAPRARLLIAKVLNRDGRGEGEWVAEGLRWAYRKRADIVSMSFSARASAPVLFEVIHQMLWLRRLLICAAGNRGALDQNSIGFPGRYSGVITVAAHDEYGNPTSFTSRGGEIDFIAPGANVWSTYPGGRYAKLSGTSMATPFVAGLAALILSKHIAARHNRTPIRNNQDLHEHLLRLATHPGHHDNATGYGALRPLRDFIP